MIDSFSDSSRLQEEEEDDDDDDEIQAIRMDKAFDSWIEENNMTSHFDIGDKKDRTSLKELYKGVDVAAQVSQIE